MGKTIGIVSLKGGVGKTTTTVALGHAIADLGKRVLLVDANFSAPNLGIHLNIIDPEKTINHVMIRKANITETIQKIGNLDVIPGSLFEIFNFSPLRLKEVLSLIKRDYDFILIDSSPALNEETLATILASDEIFIVSTPDVPTLATSIKAIVTARRRGTPINGIILNKVYDRDFEIPLREIEKTTETPILAVVPHDTRVPESLSKFTPYTKYRPNAKGSQEYIKLAEIMTGKRKVRPLRRFWKFFVSPQEVNREIFYKNVFK